MYSITDEIVLMSSFKNLCPYSIQGTAMSDICDDSVEFVTRLKTYLDPNESKISMAAHF